MLRVLRAVGVCLAVCTFAARAEAASVTLAWDPNSETDLARYYVGYRTSPTGSETLVNVGLATTWSLTNAVAGQTYYFRVYAEDNSGSRSAPSNEVSTTVPTTPPPTGGGYALDSGQLSYGAVRSGSTITTTTPAQTLMVTRTSGTAGWTATTSHPWLQVSPSSGTETGPLTVSITAGSLDTGTYDGTVTVQPTGTAVTLNVAVRTRVYAEGTTTAPGGFFDTPTDGATDVAGAIPVTGWAVDDVAVSRVDIYRDPVPGEPNSQLYLGTATFIPGSRPDIEPLFPEHPLNYRAGWGLMVLTNYMPDLVSGRPQGGNGSFRLHAYAIDAEGQSSYLGTKEFTSDNDRSPKPFGAIDTPSQGGTASGNSYVVFGWALTPQASIPTDGSTITVLVDGAPVGRPVYNNFRSDIAALFPEYANSNGAVGYYVLDTTSMANGLHTISWVVTDTLGNTEGVGSRFFTVANGSSGAMTAAAVQSSTVASGTHGDAIGQRVETVSDVPADFSLVDVKKVASDNPEPQTVMPDSTGEVKVQTRETEHVEVRLANQFDESGGTYEGYLVVGGEMRPLPVGSSLDEDTGVFTWEPGPGFVGNYEFVFLRNLSGGSKTRIPVNLRITPKFDRGDRARDERR